MSWKMRKGLEARSFQIAQRFEPRGSSSVPNFSTANRYLGPIRLRALVGFGNA